MNAVSKCMDVSKEFGFWINGLKECSAECSQVLGRPIDLEKLSQDDFQRVLSEVREWRQKYWASFRQK